MERAVQSEAIDAAWSHVESPAFARGESLTSAFGERRRHKACTRRRSPAALMAQRDSAQAALERFLQVMQSALAVH